MKAIAKYPGNEWPLFCMDKEHKAIERIRTASEMFLHYYGKPLVCTYSGGKDSDVVLELILRSGIPFEAHHSHTTADAPQTVCHIRDRFQKLGSQGIKCRIDYHRNPDGTCMSMWNLIPAKLMPPTRKVRYCCKVLKETGCANRMIATGIRWGESSNRKNRESFEALAARGKGATFVSDEKMLLTDNDERRRLFEKCDMKAKTAVNPIIDWKDSEVWDFYWHECKHHNPLYKMGFFRVGCIGCPMAGKGRYREFAEFPKYKDAYIRTFERMLDARARKGLGGKWKTGMDVFLWWMEDKNIDGQMEISDFIG